MRALIASSLLVPLCFYLYFFSEKDNKAREIVKVVRKKLSQSIESDKGLPKSIIVNGVDYKLNYSEDQELTSYIKNLLSRFNTDFTSVVVVENKTGRILSLVDYDGVSKNFSRQLSLSSQSPAASIFKVVTAAALIEKGNVELDTTFQFRGRSTTLYKSQLKQYKNKRWVRNSTLKRAFAVSNNVIFARAAQRLLEPEDIITTAKSFGFGVSLLNELEVDTSSILIPESKYEMAELASGFNRQTTMSPLHASVLSSIVANDGVYVRPRLVMSAKNAKKQGWDNKAYSKRVLSKETSNKIRKMMRLTVERGTARSQFRYAKNLLSRVEIGGKTGSITGGVPYGKRDWFMSYSLPYDKSVNGISVAVMIINHEKWYVRSTFLAKEIYEYYYSKKEPQVAEIKTRNY